MKPMWHSPSVDLEYKTGWMQIQGPLNTRRYCIQDRDRNIIYGQDRNALHAMPTLFQSLSMINGPTLCKVYIPDAKMQYLKDHEFGVGDLVREDLYELLGEKRYCAQIYNIEDKLIQIANKYCTELDTTYLDWDGIRTPHNHTIPPWNHIKSNFLINPPIWPLQEIYEEYFAELEGDIEIEPQTEDNTTYIPQSPMFHGKIY